MNLEVIYNEVKREIPTISHGWFSEVYFGFISFIMGNVPHACETFQASLSRDSSNAEIHSFLGYIYFKEGKYFDARISLERSIEIDPYFYGNYGLLITCYKKLNQFEHIVEIAERGLEHFPQDWCLLMELAHTLAVLERTDHIHEILKTAISSLSKLLPEGKKKRKYYKKLDLI
ncbi:hypothetical protein ES705_50782 [subsurface metagenome]